MTSNIHLRAHQHRRIAPCVLMVLAGCADGGSGSTVKMAAFWHNHFLLDSSGNGVNSSDAVPGGVVLISPYMCQVPRTARFLRRPNWVSTGRIVL